ncbi:MAG TPA: hypothetical protein VGG04_10305 [Candidatus Sulfotelmatobacter sp.]
MANFSRTVLVLVLAIGCAVASPVPHRDEATVEELKARLSTASVSDRPHICVEIAEKQLTETDRLYAASDLEKAQASLSDVVAYSEMARDYAVKSHKYQKQAEIAVRGMARKLTELSHSLGHDEQAPVEDAVGKLESVRDDLLSSMFKKRAK